MNSIKHHIKTWLKRRLGVPQIEFALERLARSGVRPELVFDVGAYQGDFARTCRSLWQQSDIACFEVQPAPLARLRAGFANDPKFRAWPCLLGASLKDQVPLHLVETASSVLDEHIQHDYPVACFPMRTVDDVVQRDYGGRAPGLLKLDVQGYELEVLKGAEGSLKGMRVILLETNFLDIYRNVPLVGEVMHWLRERGWVAYDICGLTRRPLDRALWQADMIFVPEGSPLRRDKRWN